MATDPSEKTGDFLEGFSVPAARVEIKNGETHAVVDTEWLMERYINLVESMAAERASRKKAETERRWARVAFSVSTLLATLAFVPEDKIVPVLTLLKTWLSL